MPCCILLHFIFAFLYICYFLLYNCFGDIMKFVITNGTGRSFKANPEYIQKKIEEANRVTVEMAAQQEREAFAERLKDLRSKAGLTQYQLADKAGIDRTLITRYETAKTMPRPKAIEKLAAALNVPLSALDITPTTGTVAIIDTTVLRKHGMNIRNTPDGLTVISFHGYPEITMTETRAAVLIERCNEETQKAFSEVMENYFANLFIRELYTNYKEPAATDSDQNDTTNNE